MRKKITELETSETQRKLEVNGMQNSKEFIETVI